MNKNTSNRLSILSKISDLALVLCAGATWGMGYVFVPILFAHFSRTLAGEIAGQMFNAINVLILSCAALMLLDLRVRFARQLQFQRELWWIVGLVFLVLIQYLGLSPKMEALKMLFPNEQAETSFGRLHGVSQVFYLLQSGTLGYLIWQRFYVIKTR